MSIKKIIVFVLLVVLVYFGGYVAIFGTKQYLLYSGAERDFNYMTPAELQPELNIKGDIETVTYELLSVSVSNNILGIPIGKRSERKYYALPLGYEEDQKNQKYCVIAVNEAEDIAEVEKLMKTSPAPLDPDAPRFEFRGLVMNMPDSVYQELTEYLWEIYDTEFNIYGHKNVSGNIIPYAIFVKGNKDGNFLLPIIVGGSCAVISAVFFVILAVRTYKKKHMYD